MGNKQFADLTKYDPKKLSESELKSAIESCVNTNIELMFMFIEEYRSRGLTNEFLEVVVWELLLSTKITDGDKISALKQFVNIPSINLNRHVTSNGNILVYLVRYSCSIELYQILLDNGVKINSVNDKQTVLDAIKTLKCNPQKRQLYDVLYAFLKDRKAVHYNELPLKTCPTCDVTSYH